MNVEEIRKRMQIGYTIEIYGNYNNLFDQMQKDIKYLMKEVEKVK